MSKYAPIKRTEGWFKYEAKEIVFTCVIEETGEPFNLLGKDLMYRYSKAAGSETVYLTKTTGISISGPGNNIATVTLLPHADYANMPTGESYHEFINTTDDILLAWGEAYLHPMKAVI